MAVRAKQRKEHLLWDTLYNLDFLLLIGMFTTIEPRVACVALNDHVIWERSAELLKLLYLWNL